MKAVVENEHGGPEALRITEEPTPEVGPDDVLINVSGAGLNRADTMQRKGKYPPPKGASNVYGLEISGTIAHLGDDAARTSFLKQGQNVVALLAGGGYSTQVVVNHAQVLPAPAGIDLVDAAALPEVGATVWSNLFGPGGLNPDGPEQKDGEQSVLIHGGTGGIGAHAVQLCRALGYHVFTTVGTQEKADWVKDLATRQEQANQRKTKPKRLGELVVINYRDQDFAEVIEDKTEGQGVRAILDVVGGDYLSDNVKSLSLNGLLTVIAVQSGPTGELNLARLMSKRATVRGTTLRGRTSEKKGEILRNMAGAVWRLIADGLIDPAVERRFAFDDVQAAHEYFDSGEQLGKTVLVMH
ncbi:NAD(P)H-quinone oxidoreductase [Kocuria sp. TGY1127_2]|uniref:NAD(P)H-quinone oxidoreductase n=1 Tax=Kocuria sp. TGY1127_2 TaxID=2711328 RepID=UPI0015BC8C02|nr:NAD(P)H-quinone oxidoreductase [Kocuria sp. TGY1127_2]